MASLDLKSKYSKILIKNGISEEIEKVEIEEPSSLVGAHTASECQFVKVQFKDDKIEDSHFFVKRPMKTSDKKIHGMFSAIMLREGIFLTHFRHEMDQFYKEKLGNDNKFFEEMFPTAYYGGSDSLILENISRRGYAMSDKSLYQDKNQAKLVLKSLAKLHAVSHVLINNAGSKEEFLEKYPTMVDRMLLMELDGLVTGMFEPPFKRLFKLIRDSGVEGCKEAAEKLSKFDGNIITTFRTMLNAESLLQCVNHGDCWNNNMMFSKNGDHVSFVDLQIHRVASPSVDIAYYLFTSTQQEVLCQWQDLLKFYYEEFKSTSFEIGNPISFTYEDLVKDFAVKADQGFLIGILFCVGMEAMGSHDVDRDGYKENKFDAALVDYIPTHKEKVEGFVSRMIYLLHIYEQVKTYA